MNAVVSRALIATLAGAAALRILPSAVQQRTPEMLRNCAERVVNSRDFERTAFVPGDTVWLFRGDSFALSCPRERKRVRADSANYFEASQQLQLFGKVHYSEPGSDLRADKMTYFRRDDHIEAAGNISAVTQSGSSLRAAVATYYTKNPQLGRTRDALTAAGRPHVVLVERDSAAGTEDMWTVDANTVAMNGPLVFLGGNVIIDGTRLTARGDSVFVDRTNKDSSLMRLLRDPQIQGKGDQEFTMDGVGIDVFLSGRDLTRILSMDSAAVETPKILLRGDTVDLRVNKGELDRAYVFGNSRAHAEARDYVADADSLDIHMPQRRLEQVRAIGKAHLEFASPDSTVITKEKNFIDGDTVLAGFRDRIRPVRDSAARRDTTSAGRGGAAGRGGVTIPPPVPQRMDTQPELESLTATGSARVLLQTRSRNRNVGADCPDVQYAVGHRIVVERDLAAGHDKVRVERKDTPVQSVRLECPAQAPTGRGRSGGARDTVPRIPPA